ncbi:MAG TPA: hypothetical protein PKE06_10285 [Flavilitoribacter sp.]|nr:hypothetical protein [Flavilitoribacter sp.]HMQ87292.1 hypothetical protein [Flavilitoribacter sp.]
MIGLLHTWSAVQRYKLEFGVDPVENLAPELPEAWGDLTKYKTATWKITVKAGRVK